MALTDMARAQKSARPTETRMKKEYVGDAVNVTRSVGHNLNTDLWHAPIEKIARIHPSEI